MSNYSQITSFTPKDSLPSGNPSKVIMGADFDGEFNAISVAVATKADTTTVSALTSTVSALSTEVDTKQDTLVSGTNIKTINSTSLLGSGNLAVGTGDVVGPASSVDNTLPRFDGTTGKLIQGSGVVVSDSNSLETNVGAAYGGYRVKGTSSASNGFEVALSSNGLTGNLWLYENAALRFATNNTERMTLDNTGNLTLNSGTLGYGTGAGGTVTQVTSKSTTVTLNKPSGKITTHNAALAAGTAVQFTFVNSFITANDLLTFSFDNTATWSGPTAYSIRAVATGSGGCFVVLKNESGGSLSEAVIINFAVTKGATA